MLEISNKDKILITGHSGMVGKSLVNILMNRGYNLLLTKNDLRIENYVDSYFNCFKPDYVIHLAAKVGGVKINNDLIGDFYTDNIKMNTNVLYYSHKYKVKKVLSLLSTCIYPDEANYPLTEDQIHNGPPHESNYTYAYTKRMIDIQSKAYRQQFGDNFVTIVPNNLYGPGDNFDLNSSHVIPALIRKIYEAKLNNSNVEIWGNGSSLREFTYVDDLSNIILYMLKSYNEKEPINVGCTNEYSIMYLTDIISKILDFHNEVIWDTTKPSGQYRKKSSNKKFKLIYGTNFNYTKLEDGLLKTCIWFKENYPNIRGICEK